MPRPGETLRGRRSVLDGFGPRASRRAIYIDYEGNKFAPPTLLGWRIEGVYGAAIVEPAFAGCANRYRAKEPTAQEHKTAVRALLRRALNEDRHIVSWSTHDLKQMWRVLGRTGRARLQTRYVNALDLARPWHRKKSGCTAPGGARLAYFAELFAIAIPERFGEQVVGANLSIVRREMVARGRYGRLEPGDRNRWTIVVRHNKWDLKAMDQIVSRICRSAARAGRRATAV